MVKEIRHAVFEQIKTLIVLGGLPWFYAMIAIVIASLTVLSEINASVLILSMIASGAFTSIYFLSFKLINGLFVFVNEREDKHK